MNVDFSSIHNHREREVCAEVMNVAARQPWLSEQRELLADVACVALNRLPPHYIRHDADFAFHLAEGDRVRNQKLVTDAVEFAFGFVQARTAMKARC